MRRFTKVSGMLLLLLMTAWTQMFALVAPLSQEEALTATNVVAGKRIALWPLHQDNQGWFATQANRPETISGINSFLVVDAGEGYIYLQRLSDQKYLTKSADNNTVAFVDGTEGACKFKVGKPGTNDEFPAIDGNNDGQYTTWDPTGEYAVRFAPQDFPDYYLNGSNGFATGLGFWSVFYVKDLDALPFKLSDAPSNGQFAENTNWYYLKINSAPNLNRYAAYTEEVDGNDNQISLTPSNPVSYGSFWAFVKTNDGIQIYNAATGTSKVLTVSDVAYIGGDATVYMLKMIDNTTSTKNVWSSAASGRTGYYQFKTTENYYINHTDANLTTDGKGKTLYGKLNATGEWSDLMFEPVENIETLIEETRTNQQAITGAVGTLASESYDDFTAALNKGTIEGLVEALKIRDLTGTTVQFDVNNAYYLFAYASASTTKYMQINNMAALNSGNKQTDNASIIWKFSGDESNGYKISGQGEYLDKVTTDSQNVPTVSNEDAAASYNLIKVPNKAAAFYIRPTDGKGLHIASNGKVVGWNEGGGSEWYLIEAPSIDIEITSAGYATVNYPFAVQLPEGLTAYTGTANAEKSKFILEEVPGGAVPANTPVVIQGPKGTHTLAINYENAAKPISRDLSGSLLPIEILSDDYILAINSENVVGFYKTTAGGTLAQNKAYIKSTPAIQAIRGFGFSTEGDGTTGIENTVTETENEEYYDLQGRRVMNPTKGIYVTKNGKKVLFVK